MIFVFGSNEGGIHGAGAALFARKKHGAVMGVGNGITGNAYAIPTKDKKFRTLSLVVISCYVDQFIKYANENPDLNFQVTAIGTGLAGYSHSLIAPMFNGAPKNCFFDEVWKPYLSDDHSYWGSF